MKTAVLIILLPLMAPAMDRLSALSMVESGDNDRAVGRAGEISRYQVLKREWRSVTNSVRYSDPRVAKGVVLQLVEKRVRQFQAIYKREPTNFEFYALWNAPAQVFNGRIRPVVAERARRFSNLCNWPAQNAGTAKPPAGRT